MKEFADRLQWLIDNKKITQMTVAKGLEINRTRITDWLKGDVKKPQRLTIIKLSDFFGCSFNWLKDNIGQPFDVDSIAEAENYIPPQGSGRITTPTYIPVVGKVPAGIPDTNEWEIAYHIQVPDMPSHCFAMKVTGDSMEPRILEGEHVIFTIDYDLHSGDVVIVTDEYGDSMVKRYKEKDGEKYLVSDNSKYEPVKPNSGFDIVGKVINSVLIKKH